MTFKNKTTKATTRKSYRCYVLAAKENTDNTDNTETEETTLAISAITQVASNQVNVTFNKDASEYEAGSYTISATDGTKEIGVKTVTYSDNGKTASITTYTNVDDGVTYTVTCGELTGSFTASVGAVERIYISTANAQVNVKTAIEFTLFDANNIDVTPSVDVDSTCVITLSGSYVTYDTDKASDASVTMGTIGDTVDVTITYNSGLSGAESITETQTVTCVAADQTIGTTVFAQTSTINNNSECAKFYLGASSSIVTLKENASDDDIYFCAKDSSGDVISYDKYEVESSNDDVATVTVTKDSGRYMQLTVNGNKAGTATLNISASKNGAATSYTIPVKVSAGTTAVKMVASIDKPTMSNVYDDNYAGYITAKLYDANGDVVAGEFTYEISKVVAEDKTGITVTDAGEVTALDATPGTYAVKVTGSENKDMSYAFTQNVSITVKALPDAAYDPEGSGIKVTYQVELGTTIDENPEDTSDDSTTAKLYAVYNGLFAGYVNEDGTVSDTTNDKNGDAITYTDTDGADIMYGETTQAKGIIVDVASRLASPQVTVKFGNQYFKASSNTVSLFNPSSNALTTTIKTDDDKANLVLSDGTAITGYVSDLTDSDVDITIDSIDVQSEIVYGDVDTDGNSLWTQVARTGTYTVEYYYMQYSSAANDGAGGWVYVTTPISKTFTVTNSLTLPTVTVTTKKVSSFTESKLIEVLKASVDMNNNTSDYESIIDLTNGYTLDDNGDVTTTLSDGTESSDGLKITYKYAIVEDNFGNGTWQFFVPISTTFSYQ